MTSGIVKDNTRHIKPEVEQVIKDQKERTFIGCYRPKVKGGRIYRYDMSTGTMHQAELKVSETKGERSKIHMVPESIYIEALNKRNAFKRLIKGKIICHTCKVNG